MDIQPIQDLKNDIQKTVDVDDKKIQLGFYSNKKKAWIDLLNDSSVETKITEKILEYNLQQPILVHRIALASSKEIKLNRLNLDVFNADNSWVKVEGKALDEDSETIYYDFGMIITKFRLSCSKGNVFDMSTLSLKTITLSGWDIGDIGKLEETVDSYFSLESELLERIEKVENDYNKKIADLTGKESYIKELEQDFENSKDEKEEELSSLEKEIDNQEKVKDSLVLQNSELHLTKKGLDEEVAKLTVNANSLRKENIEADTLMIEKRQDLKNIAEEISRQKNELEKLNKDVSLFADDVKGYAKQGAAQIKNSLWVIVPSIVIVLLIAGWSICLTYMTYKDFTGNPNLFLPLELLSFKVFSLLFSGLILTALYRFCSPFIIQIIEINKKRLRLSEVTILAQDVTNSACTNFNISEEEKIEIRLNVRMQIIREFLSGKFDSHSKTNVKLDSKENVTEFNSKSMELDLKSLLKKNDMKNTLDSDQIH